MSLSGKCNNQKYLVLYRTNSEGIISPSWGLEPCNGVQELEAEVTNVLNEIEQQDPDEHSVNKMDDVLILRVDDSFKFDIKKVEKTITMLTAKLMLKVPIAPSKIRPPISLVIDEDRGE